MPRQLLDHPEPEDRLFRGMMQHMQPDQPRVKLSIILEIRFRHPSILIILVAAPRFTEPRPQEAVLAESVLH
jgi:hypothetical protein